MNPASIPERAIVGRRRSGDEDPWTGRSLAPERPRTSKPRTSKVVLAFLTVWVVATLAVTFPIGPLWFSPVVGIVVVVYLAVVGLPVYGVMAYWGKRSIAGYTVAALVAGIPITVFVHLAAAGMFALYYLAVAGVCGPVGYWIVEFRRGDPCGRPC